MDVNRDGKDDGSVNGGVSFDIKSDGKDGKGESSKKQDPTKNSDGTAIAGASGGMLGKGTVAEKGLSVVAIGNEKMITATVGVAGAGAVAVTGAAAVNVISATTEAMIGDGVKSQYRGGWY